MNTGRLSLAKWGFLLLLTLTSANCVDRESVDAPGESTRAPTERFERFRRVVQDVGIVEDNVSVDVQLVDGETEKAVSGVERSCGCTEVSVQEGQVLSKATPCHVFIGLENTKPGPQTQEFSVTFTDGSKVGVVLEFRYQPRPFVEPASVVVRASKLNASVTLSFPGEETVEITKIEAPAFMLCEAMPEKSSNGAKIRISFSVSEIPTDSTNREGMIQLATSSTRKTDFQIPFLILEN